MSDVRTDEQAPGASPAGAAATPTASPPAAPENRRNRPREMALRFLTLREGSIVVVTLLAALYFTVKTDRFFTHANFVTLLPYFAPFAILAAGEVLLMVPGEIDPSSGSGYLFTAFMFFEFNQGGVRLVGGPYLAPLFLCVGGAVQ